MLTTMLQPGRKNPRFVKSKNWYEIDIYMENNIRFGYLSSLAKGNYVSNTHRKKVFWKTADGSYAHDFYVYRLVDSKTEPYQVTSRTVLDGLNFWTYQGFTQ